VTSETARQPYAEPIALRNTQWSVPYGYIAVNWEMRMSSQIDKDFQLAKRYASPETIYQSVRFVSVQCNW
jgi:hypothetical protein